jgi:hypothetical protein
MLNSQTGIMDVIILGAELYGCTSRVGAGNRGGKLFKWNGVNAWTEVADTYFDVAFGCVDCMLRMVVLSGEIYAASGSSASEDGGRLFKWNGINAWVFVADKIGNDTCSLIVFNNKIYTGTNALNGRLLEWNGVNAWVQVAPMLNGQKYIYSMVEYHGELYGGTRNGGRLFKWNGINAWTEVAPQLGVHSIIYSICVHNDEIYGTTQPGDLVKWNGVNAWLDVAPQLGANNFNSAANRLYEFNGSLYVGVPNGKLLMFDGINAWVEVIPVQLALQVAYPLIGFNGKLYAGTGFAGRLFLASGIGGGYKRLVNYPHRKTLIGR